VSLLTNATKFNQYKVSFAKIVLLELKHPRNVNYDPGDRTRCINITSEQCSEMKIFAQANFHLSSIHQRSDKFSRLQRPEKKYNCYEMASKMFSITVEFKYVPFKHFELCQ
jgi:hypothetical protein